MRQCASFHLHGFGSLEPSKGKVSNLLIARPHTICESEPTTHDDRFRALALRLEDGALAAAVAEHSFSVQQEELPALVDALCAEVRNDMAHKDLVS